MVNNCTFAVMMKLSVFIIALLVISPDIFSQTPKRQIKAVRINTPLKTDGILDEEAWQEAPIATDFVQLEPYNGKPAYQRTEVKFVYDNSALYIGAMMYDSAPDSIYEELAERDNFECNSDAFAVMISPFNDGLNAYAFGVTVPNVQTDVKFSGMKDDADWEAVWYSNTKKTDQGWCVEIKIPYSAIRFPKKEIQLWGLNIFRVIKRKAEMSSWNYINPEISGMINQAGELTGIENIEPPIRLSFTPYVTGYLEKDPEQTEWAYSLNGGMDLKYGLNESFTLDMTLIPDFGQVQSDDLVSNLSPFETYYGEKRPFFTEGTELFGRCEIFYSRRIGSEPDRYEEVEEELYQGEEIISNPSETGMINATKVSGRTPKGLGIGFFNAMTSNTYAVVADSSGNEHKIITQPFTNYNMLVFDQTLKNNSYFSLVNTNVMKERDGYSANVTGTEFDINNKKNTYGFWGGGNVSQKYFFGDSTETGLRYYVGGGKISGNFIFDGTVSVMDDKYDVNDMGFLEYNNEIEADVEVEYHIYDPFWKLLNWHNEFSVNHTSLYNPGSFAALELQLETYTTFKNQMSSGIEIEVTPVESNDYFEPRVWGRKYVRPASYSFNSWFNSDRRKKLALHTYFGTDQTFINDRSLYYCGGNLSYRVNNKLQFSHNIHYAVNFDNRGYVYDNEDSVYFGLRDIQTIINTFSTMYILNNRSSISFRMRHYWQKVIYYDFYLLNENGYLENSDYQDDHDINFNTFSGDFRYTWWFAPGSQLSVVWKNAFLSYDNIVVPGYWDNLSDACNRLIDAHNNSFSIRLLYYLDYLYLKKKK